MGLLSFGSRVLKNVGKIGTRIKAEANRLGQKVSRALQSKPPTHELGAEDETKFMANLSNQAYIEPNKRVNVDGFELDDELSDLKTAVYHHPTKKETYVSYRGTADADDLMTDSKITQGKHRGDHQFIDAENKFEKAQKKYGKVSGVTGHSLGGTKTQHISKKYNVKGHAFNAGTGIDETYIKDSIRCKLPRPPKFCDKLTSHKVQGDPISYLSGGYGKKKTYKTKKPYLNHSLSNWL